MTFLERAAEELVIFGACDARRRDESECEKGSEDLHGNSQRARFGLHTLESGGFELSKQGRLPPAVDNYEWHSGFGPERFGLIGFDPVTLARSVKESGRWFAELIRSGVLDPARIP